MNESKMMGLKKIGKRQYGLVFCEGSYLAYWSIDGELTHLVDTKTSVKSEAENCLFDFFFKHMGVFDKIPIERMKRAVSKLTDDELKELHQFIECEMGCRDLLSSEVYWRQKMGAWLESRFNRVDKDLESDCDDD